MFADHNKLEDNSKKTQGKSSNIQKLNTKERNSQERLQNKLNEKETKTYQNLIDKAKAVRTGKLRALNA